MSEYDLMFTMSALNMAIVSLYRITSSGDRLTLDQEYSNIINNLNRGGIASDSEMNELYDKFLEVIQRGRLRDDKKREMSESYFRSQQKGIRSIISGNFFQTFDPNPVLWLKKLAEVSASEYLTRRKESETIAQTHKEKYLKLREEELNEYNALQRKLLFVSGILLNRYHLPDKYRLTDEGLRSFSDAVIQKPPQCQRMLRSIKRDFSVYAPYWFYRAKAASESGMSVNIVDDHLAKFDEVWRPVLKHDPYRVEFMKFKINRLMRGGMNKKNTEEILKCIAEIVANTDRSDLTSNIYIGIMYFMLGFKEEAELYISWNVDAAHETEISQKLLALFNGESLREEKIAQSPKRVSFSGWFSRIFPNRARTNTANTDGADAVQQTYSELARQYREAAEQGDTKAQFKLGEMCYNGLGVKKDYVEAARWYTEVAERGFAEAQFRLGNMYYYGKGVRHNVSEACLWWEKAAQQGHAEAQINLGNVYFFIGKAKISSLSPTIIPIIFSSTVQMQSNSGQDFRKAAKLYRQSARRGSVSAQVRLGEMYSSGSGIQQDYRKAAQWYRKAAENGFSEAQCRLGEMYFNGLGLDQDYRKAVKWLTKASSQGFAEAQFSLGEMYFSGCGLTQNYTEAAKLFLMAAKQDFSEAQCRLGIMYFNGWGMSQDFRKAVKWFFRAAGQGNIQAQIYLGDMYNSGEGIKANKSEARKWYQMAAEQGSLYAEEKLELLA